MLTGSKFEMVFGFTIINIIVDITLKLINKVRVKHFTLKLINKVRVKHFVDFIFKYEKTTFK